MELQCMQPLRPELTCHHLQQRVCPLARRNNCSHSALGCHPGCVQLQAGQAQWDLLTDRQSCRAIHLRSNGVAAAWDAVFLLEAWGVQRLSQAGTLKFSGSIDHRSHCATCCKVAPNLSSHVTKSKSYSPPWPPCRRARRPTSAQT